MPIICIEAQFLPEAKSQAPNSHPAEIDTCGMVIMAASRVTLVQLAPRLRDAYVVIGKRPISGHAPRQLNITCHELTKGGPHVAGIGAAQGGANWAFILFLILILLILGFMCFYC